MVTNLKKESLPDPNAISGDSEGAFRIAVYEELCEERSGESTGRLHEGVSSATFYC